MAGGFSGPFVGQDEAPELSSQVVSPEKQRFRRHEAQQKRSASREIGPFLVGDRWTAFETTGRRTDGHVVAAPCAEPVVAGNLLSRHDGGLAVRVTVGRGRSGRIVA